MVGRLSLQDVPELLDMKKRGERVLDSPDSGLPPSPSPLPLPLPGGTGGGAGGGAGGGTGGAGTGGASDRGLPNGLPGPATPAGNCAFLPNPVAPSCPSRLCPLSFGEGVEFDPLPPKEVRYTSSVKYDSEKHFVDNVYLPVGLGVSSCSQTIICLPNRTWRSYKAEVHFEPRNKPLRFLSTTIIYPKFAKTVCTTTLDYNCRKAVRRFLSSVELEASENLGSDCLSDEC
ncbi:refilin-B [Tachyglossus aculeatus]|uniref:refilin-B n=1 Tax=Tachyglossus aculeatus TaxID=9261 RepID=UPI0018F54156|nr:refilin-B [Tachyglossus aculeatus]